MVATTVREITRTDDLLDAGEYDALVGKDGSALFYDYTSCALVQLIPVEDDQFMVFLAEPQGAWPMRDALGYLVRSSSGRWSWVSYYTSSLQQVMGRVTRARSTRLESSRAAALSWLLTLAFA